MRPRGSVAPAAEPAGSWRPRGAALLPITAAACLAVLGLLLLAPEPAPRSPASLATLVWPFDPAALGNATPSALSTIEHITPDAGPAASTGPAEIAVAEPTPRTPVAALEGYDPLVLQQIADELGTRRAALDERARAVDARAATLASVEQRIAAQLTRFEGLRDTIEGLVENVSKDEEARLARVVKVYEGMKAKSAAPIIQDLEPALALQVLRRMREPKVAAIVAEMAPPKARALTAALARPAQLPELPAMQ